jgi:hypothetical protein
VAWSKLCKPLCESRLGFRLFKNFNEAMIAKLAWWLGVTGVICSGLMVLLDFYQPSLLCNNSWVSRIEFWLPLMYSMSKSKTLNMDCHRAKTCFDAIFCTNFFETCFALLQSILIKKI